MAVGDLAFITLYIYGLLSVYDSLFSQKLQN